MKEHYLNYLRPDIVLGEWSADEELRLVHFLNERGKNWGEAEAQFPGRSLHQIKNRYYGRFKRLNERKLEQVSRAAGDRDGP